MSSSHSNALDATQRRTLRARAHQLQPTVMIGEAGLTPQVAREIEASLRSHELVKIRVLGSERDARTALALEICQQTGAQAVQHIGKVLVIYRERPSDETKTRKGRPRNKPARRLKRSFQT